MEQRRTAIISGGCGGVGSAIGKRLAKDGFDIIALYFSKSLAEAKKIIEPFAPGKHEAIQCDIRDKNAIAEILKKYPRVDVAVHAAVGPIIRKNILEITDTEFRDQFETGLFGGFQFLQQTAAVMKQQGSGTLIGILSDVVRSDARHGKMAGYAVAKHALRGMLKELKLALPSPNITVNAIAPSFLDTSLHADLPPEVRSFIVDRAPSGTMRTPDDVANAVALLSSDGGKKINGKIFSFDEKEMTDL